MSTPSTNTTTLNVILDEPTTRREQLEVLRNELDALRARARKRERKFAAELDGVFGARRVDAVNLTHYLALRSRDLRPLQAALTEMGLSSLGRMESDVLGNLDAVITMIDDALGDTSVDEDLPIRDPGDAPRERLHRAAVDLLGGTRDDRITRIMVTMPKDAADDPELVESYVEAGLDLARINCAHDNPEAWARMAKHLRGAMPRVRIAMDLAGPKVRTGPIVAAEPTEQNEQKPGKKKKGKRPALVVHRGDVITVTADSTAPVQASEGPTHRIGCTLPEALVHVEPGHEVSFDDGKITGVVTATRGGEIDVRVILCSKKGSRLRAKKGINFPDSEIDVPALTAEDREALPHVIALADIVELSFTRSAQDVRDLFDALDELALTDERAARLGIVVKIETPSGFAALPEIMFELMRRERVGVMIARGDLGVEVGFARLAEVQEEMLWLCEAARVPVIWATEVLANLAATGVPTRSEVTDAAAGNRAECVMLNKGPYMADTITKLNDILTRMHEHSDKKRPLLRRLKSWERDD